MQKDLDRAREILNILKSEKECDNKYVKEQLKKELKDIEDKYKVVFYY